MADESTLVALALDDVFSDDLSESASAASNSVDTPTRAPPAEELQHKRTSKSLLSKDTTPISDELDRMLSLTQTFSFWDNNNERDDDKTMGATFDEDATYDDEDSYYDQNSLASYDTEDGYRRRIPSRKDRGLLACGEFTAAVGKDASDVLLESLADTTRLLSMTKLSLENAKSKFEMKFMKTKAKEDKKRQREEQLRLEREERAREEMMAARAEAGVLAATLWREK